MASKPYLSNLSTPEFRLDIFQNYKCLHIKLHVILGIIALISCNSGLKESTPYYRIISSPTAVFADAMTPIEMKIMVYYFGADANSPLHPQLSELGIMR